MFLEKNFIASAVGLRTISMTFNVEDAQEDENGKMYIPAGYFIGGGDGYTGGLAGVVLDNVYFKEGQETAIGALVVAGHIFNDRLPVEVSQEDINNAALQGLYFETAPVTVINGEGGEDESDPENPEEFLGE